MVTSTIFLGISSILAAEVAPGLLKQSLTLRMAQKARGRSVLAMNTYRIQSLVILQAHTKFYYKLMVLYILSLFPTLQYHLRYVYRICQYIRWEYTTQLRVGRHGADATIIFYPFLFCITNPNNFISCLYLLIII